VKNSVLGDRVEVHLVVPGGGDGVLDVAPVATLETDEHAHGDVETGGKEADEQRPGPRVASEERRGAHYGPEASAVHYDAHQHAGPWTQTTHMRSSA
jgi:hypothetical protein